MRMVSRGCSMIITIGMQEWAGFPQVGCGSGGISTHKGKEMGSVWEMEKGIRKKMGDKFKKADRARTLRT